MKILVVLVLLFFNAFSQPQTLRVLNFNDYIDKSVLIEFSKEHNVTIYYALYENNAQMLDMINSDKDGFDLACPSTSFVNILIESNKVKELNKTKLSNFNNIFDSLLNPTFDQNNRYTVPYFWGTIGIIYNKNRTSAITSWNDLWREDLRNSLLIGSDYRDVFGFVLKSLNYSINTTKQNEIDEAYNKLLALIPNIKEISSDNVYNYFINDNFSAGVVFNGDATTINEKDDSYIYVYPQEGAIKWIDSFVLLKDGKNSDLAHKFLNKILDANISAKIAKEVGYASANKKAFALLDKSVQNDPIIYPSKKVILHSETLQSLDKSIDDKYKEKWANFLNEYKKQKGQK